MIRGFNLSDNIRPILGTIRSVPVPPKPGEAPHAPTATPFITVSRQPGAGGGPELARRVLDALNQSFTDDQQWTVWDRELIEKVASDMHLSARLIDSLEDRGHSWFSDFLESLSLSDDLRVADEAAVYSRVTKTIRALAQAGRVIIVGRGGVFITRHMPGGIHIRLVAPFEHRVAHVEREQQLSHSKAAAHVKELDRHRQAFYHRYWPNETMNAETFALTINTAIVPPDQIVRLVTALVPGVVAAAR